MKGKKEDKQRYGFGLCGGVLGFSFPSFIQSLRFSLIAKRFVPLVGLLYVSRSKNFGKSRLGLALWAFGLGPKPNEDIRQTSSSSSSPIAVLGYKLGSRQIDATAYL